MAGWICQTRKILSTVVSSLADDLEQTMQELNDVIYRFGATHADSSPTNPLTLSDAIPDTECPHLEEQPPEKQDSTVEEAPPHKQVQEQFISILTRQPETSGFPSTLNSRLSQSSPTLQISENDTSGLEDSRISQMSSFHSLISSSSPCLMQSPGTSPEQPARVSLAISGRHLRQPHVYAKSSQSLKVNMKSSSQNVCPCHRRDSFKIKHGMKHPGRVIRTQSSVTLQQSQPLIIVDPAHSSSDQKSCTEKVDGKSGDDYDSPRLVLDLKDREPGSQWLNREHGSQLLDREHVSQLLDREHVSQQLKREGGNYQLEKEHGSYQFDNELSYHQLEREPSNPQLQRQTDRHHEASLTTALVEHDTHFLRWASLRPFTRILSFAFAQIANVVLLFSENSQSDHNLTSSNTGPETESKHQDVTKAVYPVGSGDHSHKRDVNMQDIQHLNVAQRTYSTDSFEIIESSCFNGAAEENLLLQRLIPEYQTSPKSQQSSSDALQFSSSHFSSDDSIRGSGAPTRTSTSSTDWVSFDFRKLLTDGQFGVDKPMFPSFAQGSGDVHSGNVGTDYEVVGENILYQSVNGDSNNGCHHVSGREDASDDDKDSSASFIILSDDDINNEFIF